MIDLKPYKTTLFIWFSLIVGEAHTFFENSKASANWIFNNYVYIPIQWNVKYAGNEIQNVLIALAFLFYRDNKVNKATIKTFLFYYILDLLFYFYNYKRDGYGVVYTLLLIFWIYTYRYGRINSTNRQGVAIKT